jgi:hypothetical protein
VSTLLGAEISGSSFIIGDFKEFVLKDKGRLAEGGRVQKWLAAEE